MDWLQVLFIMVPILSLIWSTHRETNKQIREIDREMKDFHGRLCSLEEKYIQMMQRIMEERNK